MIASPWSLCPVTIRLNAGFTVCSPVSMFRIENPRCPGEPTVLREPVAAHRVLAIRGIYTINASEGCRALLLWGPR